jgi:hypothetical protein
MRDPFVARMPAIAGSTSRIKPPVRKLFGDGEEFVQFQLYVQRKLCNACLFWHDGKITLILRVKAPGAHAGLILSALQSACAACLYLPASLFP